MDQFESTGELNVSKTQLDMALSDFGLYAAMKERIVKTMTDVYKNQNYLVCPHTSTAVIAIRELKLPVEQTICLATAHPTKFSEAVVLAVGAVPPRLPQMEELFSMKTRATVGNIR